MAYPPLPYRVADPAAAIRLMRAYPFAHFFTVHGGLRATRLPFVVDCEDGRPVRLRGHLDGQNPQARGLEGGAVLVAFSGPAAYVSPHWRADKTKGGTYDYEEVQVHGVAHVQDDVAFFRQLIDDLSALIEPQHAEIGDYPVWRATMSPPGHIESQFPLIQCLEIEIQTVSTVAKLHQGFPEADWRSVAEHLEKSHRDQSRAIARRIREFRDG